MAFVPVNGDHAIQTVTFTISLSQPISPADINLVRAGHKRWRAELPSVTTPQWADIQIESPQNPPKVVTSPGLEFSFLRPDGSPAWAVRLLGADLIVECSRYTRWARTWGRAAKYALQIFEILSKPEPVKQITSCSLVVLDRFRSDDPSDTPHGLLKRSPFVCEQVFRSGSLWHQFSGWFAQAPKAIVLNQLNLEAKFDAFTPPEDDPKQVLFTSIYHTQQSRLPSPISIRDEVVSQGKSLNSLMDFMHSMNKALIADLVEGEILRRIGFFEPEPEA